jgi:predicted RNA-binding Zn ribbon-like protein
VATLRASPIAAPAPPPPARAAASERTPPVQPADQPQSAAGGVDNREKVTEVVVTAEKRESRRQSVPAAISAFTGRIRDAIDPGARLRAAAVAGRTKDLEDLLEHGAPVDSPDAEGDTALMKSVQADHPAAAALLRRHGASLDQKNHAGESARDMARAKGDADLNQAIGLSP